MLLLHEKLVDNDYRSNSFQKSFNQHSYYQPDGFQRLLFFPTRVKGRRVGVSTTLEIDVEMWFTVSY